MSIDWLVVRAAHRDTVGHALARAWRGGFAQVVDLAFPSAQVTFVWPAGAAARRSASWPEVLTDWRDIYDEKLYPSDAIPVLAEEASGLGAEVLVAWGELGLARSTVGWYRKGKLDEYAHVGGGAQVAWTPAGGLGRPFDGSGRQVAAQASRRVAELLGAGDFVATLDRLEKTGKAVGEAILVTAFTRMLGGEPPPMDELAGKVAAAPVGRVALAG